MTKVWKTLIIDDEELARFRLRRLLNNYSELIEIAGEAINGEDGIEKIEKLRPDLIFLDVEMPVYNGFEMLSRLKETPKVIFTTAYDQYAIKAFEEDSIDYLLKPIEAERLDLTVRKLEKLSENDRRDLPLDSLMRQLNIRKERKTLTIKIGDRILLIKPEDVAFIQAEDKYVFLHCLDGKKHLTDFTVAGLEEKLSDSFVRINRGTIINQDHISEIRKGFNGSLVFILKDKENSRVSSSRRYGEALREHFEI